MTRQSEVTLAEVKAYSGGNDWIAQLMVEELIDLGIVQPLERAGDPRYRIHLAARHGRQVPVELWNPWMRQCINRKDLGVFYRSQASTQ